MCVIRGQSGVGTSFHVYWQWLVCFSFWNFDSAFAVPHLQRNGLRRFLVDADGILVPEPSHMLLFHYECCVCVCASLPNKPWS
jgi:hypothetical protein